MPVLRDIVRNHDKYRPCVPSDIGRHFEQIKHWIPHGEVPAFQERMLASIEEGNAYCTENTFLYYVKENERIAHGIALYAQNHPQEFMSMLIGIFTFEDVQTYILRFKLHPGKELEEYRTLLTDTSIHRTHRDPNHPLLIRINELRDKWIKLLANAGVIARRDNK